MGDKTFILYANTDWYLFNFRAALISYLVDSDYQVICVCPAGPYTHRLENLGAKIEIIHLDRNNLNPFVEFFYLVRLYKILNKYSSPFFMSFTTRCIMHGMFINHVAKLKLSCSNFSGLGFLRSKTENFYVKLVKYCLLFFINVLSRKNNTLFIVQNSEDEHFLNQLVSSSVTVRKIAGSGVSVERFDKKPTLELSNVVLYSGRLLRSKGIDLFVEVARRARKAGLDYVFKVAGAVDAGARDSITEKDIMLWRKEVGIEFIGQVDDIQKVLYNSFAFVSPSQYGEGVPRSALEAGAARVPIIAVRNPGSCELIEHGVDGFLCDTDADDILAKLNYLAGNNQARVSICEKMFTKISLQYDEAAINQTTLLTVLEHDK